MYWIPIFEILDARGFHVILVNARHVKNVPGRKSDVSDCEWLRDLHIARPPARELSAAADDIVALRAYLRHRATAHREREHVTSSACRKRSSR